MPDLDKKYSLIWGYEEQFAYRLGQNVIDKPSVSVWMIVLPVLFVHHMQRVSSYKNAVQAFARGILEPRQKALDKAWHEVTSGERKYFDIEDYFPSFDFTSDRDRSLADKQVRVMRILQDHYRSLLKADQSSYQKLLQEAYPGREHYMGFLDRLSVAEQELNHYLTRKVHTSEDSKAVVQRMEKACQEFRSQELLWYF